ncbi:MAG TPA: DUF882 domain-containing protein [Polyangia bacterium]
MYAVIALLFASATPATAEQPDYRIFPAQPLAALSDERASHFVPPLRERSKKEIWRLDKAWRPSVHLRDADLSPKRKPAMSRPKTTHTATSEAEARLADALEPVGTRIHLITTLFNIWNREALALIAGQPYKHRFQLFLRDHYTKQSTQSDTRLASILAAAALKFHAPRIDIVSGFRSPKYNLMLRKKGHQVARESQHMQGTAVDFRVRGVELDTLREFVRGLHVGGVGYYPRTRFIHADTGKVRYWQGS